jgi:hypothetical protein
VHKEEEKGGGSYEDQQTILPALFLIGTTLLARVAVQGIQLALLATAAEYGLNGISAGRKLLAPNID